MILISHKTLANKAVSIPCVQNDHFPGKLAHISAIKMEVIAIGEATVAHKLIAPKYALTKCNKCCHVNLHSEADTSCLGKQS